MMQFTDSFDWKVLIAAMLFILTCIAKFAGLVQMNNRTISLWVFPLSLLLAFCLVIKFIDWIAIPFIALLIVSSLIIDSDRNLLIKIIAAIIAGLIFLAMGFHVIPGFSNQILIDAQIIKQGSTTFTQYFNIDKTLGGLIFFLIVVPTPAAPNLKQLKSAALISLVTIFLVLMGGMLGQLIEFNLQHLFSFSFLVFFVLIQIFSVCLAEETFFRGFIQYRIGLLFKQDSYLQKIIPISIASLFFGIVHFGGGLGYVIAATVAGFGYGLVYQVTRRIEFAILAHTLLNLIHLIFFSYPFKV